jgi:hypothetical protein
MIALTQYVGDSKTHSIPMTWEGQSFTPDSQWLLLLSVKLRKTDADRFSLFQKALGAGITVSGSTASISVVPTDTNDAPATTYFGDIQAQSTTTGQVRTVAEFELVLEAAPTRNLQSSIEIHTAQPAYPNGPSGPPNVLTIGTVTTGEANTNASATISGTSPAQVLNLTIPKGRDGVNGSDAEVTGANMATGINAAAEKTTPANADKITITDSAESGSLKWLSWQTIKNIFFSDATTKADAAEAAAIAAAATDATSKANAAQSAAIAAAATDATNKAATKANLSGGNIISGPQQNSGAVFSSAALGTDPTQLPNQAQVIALFPSIYNVKSYGAKGDGITDDSAAINLALAACYNEGGGTVFFPDGTYKISGQFDSITNSVLTLPNAGGYSGTPRTVRIIGESRGRLNDNYTAIASGGVTLDCTSLVGTPGQAVFAGAPLVTPNFGSIQTQWNNVSVQFDDMMIVVAPNPTISGLILGNCTRASIGDNFSVLALSVNGTWGEPIGYSTGILMPQVLNNINLEVGACQIVGFLNGIIPGEHTTFKRPAIAFCKYGLKLQNISHLISGVLNLENCTYMVDTGSASSWLPVDLTLEIEQAAAGNWWSTVVTINDVNNLLRGNIRYSSFDLANASGTGISVTGGNGVKYRNLRAIDIVVVANSNAVQSIPSGGAGTKALFQNEQLDPAEAYATSRFQPRHRGWFNIHAAVELHAVPDNTFVAMYFALTTNNGATTYNAMVYEQRVGGGPFTGTTILTAERLLPFNGTTDYLEVFVFQDSGSTLNTSGTADNVFRAIQQDVSGVHY